MIQPWIEIERCSSTNFRQRHNSKTSFFAPDLLPGIHDNDDEDHGPHTEASLSQVMVPSWGMG